MLASSKFAEERGSVTAYDVVHDELDELVARLLGVSHRTIRNPSHEPPEESA